MYIKTEDRGNSPMKVFIKLTAILAAFLLFIQPLTVVLAQEVPDPGYEEPTEETGEGTETSEEPVETETEEETEEPTTDETEETESENEVEEEPEEPETQFLEGEDYTPWNKTENNKPQIIKDGNTGALSYSYPITIPATREENLDFSLSLNYNSQNTVDSMLGYSWGVSIPSIERINKTGSEKLFDETYFRSSISGELVQDGSYYYAEADHGDFLKYSFSSNVWTVTDKNGITYKFGETSSSRQDDPSNSSHIYKWMLSSITSPNANVVNFTYTKHEGQIYPDTISYNYNNTTPFNTIVFTKEIFADGDTTSGLNVPSRFNTGFQVRTEYLISKIEVKENGSWIRKYELDYTTGDAGFRQLLSTITETGKDLATSTTVTLPATTFSYKTFDTYDWEQTTDDAWETPRYFANYDGVSYMTQIMDLNGDTYPEFVECETAGINIVRINNTDGTFTSGDDDVWLQPECLKEVSNYGIDNAVRFLDVNGDLYPDLVHAIDGVLPDGFEDYEADSWEVYINTFASAPPDTSIWTYDDTIAVPVGFARGDRKETKPAKVADINGDGLSDILYSYFEDGDIEVVFLGNGSGWVEAPAGEWEIPRDLFDGGQRDVSAIEDINTDGLADLIWFNQTEPDEAIYINNGKGWVLADSHFPNNEYYKVPVSISHQYVNRDNGVRFSDVNGDSLPDSVHSANGSGSDLHIGTSNTWGVSDAWLNKDGEAGTLPELFTDTDGGDAYGRLVDINSDGLQDFLYAVEEDDPEPDDIRTKLGVGSPFSDVLETIETSEGAEINIEYTPSSQYRDGSGDLLNPSLPLKVLTVSEIITNDAFGNVGTEEFTYSGGHYYYSDPQHRKFAGFGLVTSSDPVGNVTKTYYHQGNSTSSSLGEYSDHISKIGKPFRVEEYNSSGNLYHLTVNKWDKYNLSTDHDFVKLIRQTTLDYDGDSDHKDVSTEYTYDNTTGNLTQKVEYGEVTASTDGSFTDSGTDKGTTDYSYATNGTGVYAVSQKTLTNNSGGKVTDEKRYYDNQTFGSLTLGNLTKKRDWKTGSQWADTLTSYNSYGLPTQITDPRGKVTQYSYDTYNLFPATITDPLTHTKQFVYDYSSGRPGQITEENGFIYQTKYDGFDRVTEEKIPDLTTPTTLVTKTVYAYTDTSGALSVHRTDYLDGSTIVDSYQYFDGLNRKIQSRNEMEASNTFAVRDFVYNTRGLLLKESLPYSSTGSARTTATTTTSLYTNYTYDSLKRPLTVINNVGTTSYAYDQWKTTITDANSKDKILTKDAYENLIKVDEKNGASTYTTNYKWNLNKNLTKITDALDNVRNFTYDGMGRRVTAEDLHATSDTSYGTWTYAYDDNSNLTQSVDPKSQTINYTYDDVNRVLTEDYTGASGMEISYAYDSCTNGIGKLCTATGGATTTYLYNSNGSLSSETETISSQSFTTDYTYDRQGNQLVITYPDNAKIRYTYNTAGLLNKIEVKESGGSYTNIVSNFDYNSMGQATVVAYANGLSTNNTYDSTKLYRLTNATTGTLLNESLTYDALGNVLTKSETGSAVNSGSFSYTYDDLSRLTQISATSLGSGNNFTHTFTYDAIGNLTNKSDIGNYLYQGSSGSNYANPHAATSVNGTTISYDNNGNLLTDGTATNTWNYKNEMTQSVVGGNTVTYLYDHSGNRMKYSIGGVNTLYPNKYYDKKGTTFTKHIFAGDQPVATIEKISGTSTTYYLHNDYLGSTALVTDGSTAISETLDYYPFGEIRLNQKVGSFEEKRKFTRHQIDADTNFTYLGQRYDNPKWGRFLSLDPINLVIGDQSFNDRAGRTLEFHLSNPQSLNSYTYTNNNPLKYTDPNGEIVPFLMLAAPYAPIIISAISASSAVLPAILDNPKLSATLSPGLGDYIAAREAISGVDSLSGVQLSVGERLLGGFSVVPIIGSAGDVAKGVIKGGDIVGGLRVTNHAAEGFIQRNMKPEQVGAALRGGVKYLDTKTNNILHIVGERGKGGYTVITDQGQKTLVSVENFIRNLMPKNFPNRFKKLDKK